MCRCPPELLFAPDSVAKDKRAIGYETIVFHKQEMETQYSALQHHSRNSFLTQCPDEMHPNVFLPPAPLVPDEKELCLLLCSRTVMPISFGIPWCHRLEFHFSSSTDTCCRRHCCCHVTETRDPGTQIIWPLLAQLGI
jgi:hypothetical protein